MHSYHLPFQEVDLSVVSLISRSYDAFIGQLKPQSHETSFIGLIIYKAAFYSGVMGSSRLELKNILS